MKVIHVQTSAINYSKQNIITLYFQKDKPLRIKKKLKIHI